MLVKFMNHKMKWKGNAETKGRWLCVVLLKMCFSEEEAVQSQGATTNRNVSKAVIKSNMHAVYEFVILSPPS